MRLCGGQFSIVLRFDGKVMDFGSSFGLSAEGLNILRGMLPRPASEDTASGRAILRRAVVELSDVLADPALGAQAQHVARAVTYRSIVAVPLLHEGDPIGTIAVARANAGAFPERQIALLKAFADQAVIAIRNVGLFDQVQARTEELSESLQQQTATADVLKVISRSTFDLQNGARHPCRIRRLGCAKPTWPPSIERKEMAIGRWRCMGSRLNLRRSWPITQFPEERAPWLAALYSRAQQSRSPMCWPIRTTE